MKILYDSEKDLLSIVFKDDEKGIAFERSKFGISHVVNVDEELVCIEIPNASARVALDSFSIDLKRNSGRP